MQELSVYELETQYSDLLPEREALGNFAFLALQNNVGNVIDQSALFIAIGVGHA